MEQKMKARAKQGQELGDKMDAQAKEDEARMMKIQTEARLKAEAQFQEKLRREHQKKLEIRNTLDKQVQDMNTKKMHEKEIVQKQAEVFKKQANEAMMEEDRKAKALKEAKHHYRMQLEDQVRERERARASERASVFVHVWLVCSRIHVCLCEANTHVCMRARW